MAEEPQQRRLAAIVAADVVGYSRLMEADETGTVARLKALRAELVDPAIDRHHGRIVKLTGDGMLVEFASVVDAVQCAMEIQRTLPGWEPGEEEARRIHYRIGINVGDIIIDGDDIFGDGVNIAARLEVLAKPGGVAISGTAYDQIRSKIDFGYEDAGEVEVKNIQQPVRVYHVLPDSAAAGHGAAAPRKLGSGQRRAAVAAAVALVAVLAGGGWWWTQGRDRVVEAPADTIASLLNKPAVAVLPFVNSSGDPEQESFADGLTRSLTGGLSNIFGLVVVSSSVSMTYKGNELPLPQLAEELGVKSVLEGSVQKSGDQVRINAELVDTANGRVLWSERYTRNSADLLAVQDEIVKNVVTALQVELVEGEATRTFSSTTDNTEAFEYGSRLRRNFLAVTQANNAEGLRLARKALELDPEYSRVWVSVGWFHYQRVLEGWSEDVATDQAAAWAAIDRAIELDPRLPASYTLAGLQALIFDQDFERAIKLSRKGVELNLNNAQGWWVLGIVLAQAGATEDAIQAFKQVRRLAPQLPSVVVVNIAEAYLLAGRADEAEAAYRETLAMPNNSKTVAKSYLGLALIDAGRGRDEQARTAVAKAIENDPRLSVSLLRRQWVFQDEDLLERWLGELQRLGLPD